jgi:hypothetical protein
MSLSQQINPIMRETFINKLENAWGVLIYGELFYVCTDWEMEDGESCFAFIAQMEDENSDRFYIPYAVEDTLEVSYDAKSAMWTIKNLEIPPFQILRVDSY